MLFAVLSKHLNTKINLENLLQFSVYKNGFHLCSVHRTEHSVTRESWFLSPGTNKRISLCLCICWQWHGYGNLSHVET